MSEQKLKEMKSKLEEVNTQLAIKKSEESKLKIDIDNKYGIKTVGQAEKRLGVIDKKLEDLESKKDVLIKKAEEKLNEYDE